MTRKLEDHINGLGLHWRGEPCLHPSLPKLAEIANGLGLNPWLSTNTAVHNLGKPEYVKPLLDNLKWIEICVDGYDAETASKYRVGAKWSLIEKNLNTLSLFDSDCRKVMRVLRFKYNDGKESIYRDMARKYHMDEVVFAAPLIGLEETITADAAAEWLSTKRRYQRYTQRGGKWMRRTGGCYANPVVSVHGTVHPCCLDWGLDHSLGDLKTERWKDIVNNFHKTAPRLGNQPMCKLCCSPEQKVNFREKII
jgi:MoaA/NifB/PqqE/SkfB family radical SAM enzyme